MIATVLMVSLRRLLHNRVELLLTFVVPVAFFSIFAIIFGGGVGTSATPKIKVVAVDRVNNDRSQAMLTAIREIEGLRFIEHEPSASQLTASQLTASQPTASQPTTKPSTPLYSEAKAREMVQRGTASMAIVLRSDQDTITADLLSDTSDQVAPQIVSALVQRAMMALPPPSARPANIDPASVSQAGGIIGATSSPSQAGFSPFMPPTVRIVDVLGGGKRNPVVSMYAAGIAVMFLLFGATGGGGALLEERENQTLDRLLTTGLSMDQLLLGKWFYLTGLGVVQTTVMFAWGQAVFGIELTRHLDGFLIMTLVTAGAAAAFGLLLATLCKTRGQLNGLSVVVVLTMSALGGSMVPRYVMSQSLRDAGLWTFNAWALEGYEKVFWRDLPPIDLWPQMSVLMLCGTAFLIGARLLAVRWETE